MGNTRPSTKAKQNADMMYQVCKLLGIRNDFKLWEIVRQLELKSIRLSPFHIQAALIKEEIEVFCPNTTFIVIKQIALDLWEQGIYISFPGDKFRFNDLNQLVVVSDHHSAEPLPNTIHNKLAREIRAADRDMATLLTRRQFIACLAEVIHARWKGFQRWAEHDFTQASDTDDCYVVAAFELAHEFYEDYRRKGSYQPTINLAKELLTERYINTAAHIKAVIG